MLLHDFFINKTNQSPLPDAYIFTMSNMWVECKNVSSVSIEHPLPIIQHLESLNEPNDYIFHEKGSSLWAAWDLCGEIKLGSHAEGSNTPLGRNTSRSDSLPSRADVRHFSDLYLRS